MTDDREQIVADDGDPDIARLRGGIEESRAGMTATISALETRLSPGEIRQAVGSELDHVEARIREVVQEQLGDAKNLVQAELVEAKSLLRSEIDAAEEKIKKGLGDARDAVKQDMRDALSGAKHAVRAATVGQVEDLATSIGDKMNETRETLIDTVRQNPIPATIVGVGLAWLLMNRSKSNSARLSRGPSAYGGVSETVRNALDNASSGVSRAAHQATDAAGRAWQETSEAAGGAAHAVSESASSLVHNAGDAASHLVDQAGDAALSVAAGARTGAKRMEQGLHDQLSENPLALGAAALAIGAVVGYALPRTDREDTLMGQTRDLLLHRAGDAAHEAASSAAQLAERALENITKGEESSAGASR